MTKNKQLTINLASQIIVFAVNLGVGFFLSPFIVKTIGVEANGFVTLGNNFTSYASLLATALNSMASRFVTISYVKGDNKTANEYFSSVFYANLFLSLILFIPSLFIIIFLENIVDIPTELITDVKILWIFIFLNFYVSIIGTVFSIATFATNKLYLTSIRSIIAQGIRVCILVGTYTFLPKYIWYIGIASVTQNLYTVITNYFYTKKLTPELKIKKSSFNIEKIKELLSSGIWNTISSLGTTLLESLDLLIANIFIGSKEMGILSVSKTVPGMISSLIGSAIGVFMPSLTIDYAKDDKATLIKDMRLSMKLTGLLTCVPISVLIIFGDSFYSLWQPTLDSKILQILSILTASGFLISGCVNIIFNIFTVTNNVKLPALVQVVTGVVNTLTVLLLVNITNLGIYAVAGVSSILCIIKNLFIIVPYSCKCIGIKKTTFYPDIIRCILATVTASVLGSFVNKFVELNNWFILIAFAVIYAVIGLICYLIFCTNKDDRRFLIGIFKKLIKAKG